MKTTILCISIAPSFYDTEFIKSLATMDYDTAKATMEKDEISACSVYEYVVDTTKENEMKFCCDGAANADTSDIMFVYVKVAKD